MAWKVDLGGTLGSAMDGMVFVRCADKDAYAMIVEVPREQLDAEAKNIRVGAKVRITVEVE